MHFNWLSEFDAISSYSDQNIRSAIIELKDNPQLRSVLSSFTTAQTDTMWDALDSQLDDIDSIDAFQEWVVQSIIPLIEKTYDKLTIEGLDQLKPSESYIFISNHRDIVMDPLLLNLALRTHGFTTAHCAIGDNLLISPIADKLARLNHCFKVIRSLTSPKAILKAMKIQSSYIAYRHFVDSNHIWIAQREGRAKDNEDTTNPALIKMLALSRPKEVSIGEFYNKLNIVPVCYSYEWDPCDIDKATQLHDQSESSDYVKDSSEDLVAVKKGLTEPKGKITLRFGSPIQDSANALSHKDIAEKIDTFIKSNYQLFPVNAAAKWELDGKTNGHTPFTDNEIVQAQLKLNARLENQSPEIREKVLRAYASPLR